MRWSYKTVLYGLKKDGLLGSAFLDDAEIEESLNEYGQAGWELVTMFETRDGVTAVFKQPLELPAARPVRPLRPQDERRVMQAEEAVTVAAAHEWGRESEKKTMPATEPGIMSMAEEMEEPYDEEDISPVIDSGPDEPERSGDNDEEDDSRSGIGSIRIE